MKHLFFATLFLNCLFLNAQPLTGDWHGQILDENGEVINYLNITIISKGDELIAIPKVLNKETNAWEPDKRKSEFTAVKNNAVLSRISNGKKWAESDVYLLSYVSPRKIEVTWVNQVNNTDSSDNKVWTKLGNGYLEPFLNGTIYKNLSIGGTSTNRVSIDQVEVAETTTIITFSYHNTSYEPVMMRLSKPGFSGAFYITTTDRLHKYQIMDKDNIAYEPDNTTVAANSYHTFKIYFEPIPDSLTTFSILEGDPELQSGKEWNFYDIRLK